MFTDTDHVKKGFALPALYPKESIVDPELMTTLSSRGIAGPGFDALAHAIESFLSVRANPFSKLYSRQAILWLSEGLPKVQANPSDLETWERVALGSTFAGIAIGNAGCTAPHGIEHPISGLLNVAHGEGLAAIYPEYMRFMRPHAQADFAELARLLGAETSGLTEEEASLRAVEQVDALLKTLGIAFTLSDLGGSGKPARLAVPNGTGQYASRIRQQSRGDDFRRHQDHPGTPPVSLHGFTTERP